MEKYFHHNWLMRSGSEFTDYPKFFEDHIDTVTQEICGLKYNELHPLSQSRMREQVALRYNKEVLK